MVKQNAISLIFYAAFLGLLDLFICFVLFKVTLSADSNKRLVVDKLTQKVYYLTETVPHAGRRDTALSELDYIMSES